MEPGEVIDGLSQWIKQITPATNDLLVPISGGTDSALCFYICCKALPGRALGIFAGHELRRSEWFDSVGNIRILSPDQNNELGKDDWEAEIARWTSFVSAAIYENRILVGSRNRTEQYLGTFSLASRLAWYYPLIGVWKNDIMRLCEHIGVPDEIIESSRQADPACGRPEQLARLPHSVIDTFAKVKAGELPAERLDELSQEQIDYLEKIYGRNIFKQKLPQEGPRLSLR